MDIQSTTQQQQPVSDDNELAKVLSGLDSAGETKDSSKETAKPGDPIVSPAAEITPQLSTTPPPISEPTANLAPPPIAAPAPAAGDLDSIKKAALEELRPLAGKLDLPPEEKFDTLLLIIRSTDDRELIGTAHEAAKAIPDETRRAQALLDIIKEVEYFSNPQPAQTPAAAPAPGFTVPPAV